MSQPAWGNAQPAWRSQQWQPQAGWQQQPGWQPQPNWQPQPAGLPAGFQPGPPPRRRRNPLALLLIGLIALVALALAGLVVANIAAKPAVAPYANDDYQVPEADKNPPPIPAPESLDQAKEWTTNNAVYAQTMPAPIRCEITPFDVTTADDATLKSHFETLMACLVRAWQQPLTKAGFQISRPTVTIYQKEIETKCGGGDMSHNAFYCGADQQVYWSDTLGPDLPPPSVNRFPGEEVLAHEFGHAMQGRTGLLISEHAERKAAETKDEALQSSRHTETQADCFAGLFLRSVSRSLNLDQNDVKLIQDTFAGFGDDVDGSTEEADHGKSATRRYWVTTGLNTDKIGACNTFSAPPSLTR